MSGGRNASIRARSSSASARTNSNSASSSRPLPFRANPVEGCTLAFPLAFAEHTYDVLDFPHRSRVDCRAFLPGQRLLESQTQIRPSLPKIERAFGCGCPHIGITRLMQQL